METFYIFLISYTLKGYPIERTILLKNSEQCQIAIRANEPLSDSLGADMFCLDTGRISNSIRPRLRPSTQNEDRQEMDDDPAICEDQCKRS